VTGRAIAVFQPKAFNGKRSGKFASVFIVDKSGVLRAILWNGKTAVIDSGDMKVGQILRFSHAYTKEGRDGVELHVGEKCQIEINPPDVKTSNFPSLASFATKVKDLASIGKRRVNVIGTVKQVFEPSTFERQDLSMGRVLRFILADETGETSVVAWNEKADELERMLAKGVGLRLVNASLKKSLNGDVEIHVDSGTYAETFEPAENHPRMAILGEPPNAIIEGTVLFEPTLREIKTLDEGSVKIATFQIEDEAGKAWVAAWRRHADAVQNLRKGDKVLIKDAFIKKGLSDQVQVYTRDATSITIIDGYKHITTEE